MIDSYIFPSVVLSIVVTMYTIFIAIVIFSAQYLDKDIKDMKRLFLDLLRLSIIVFLTIIYNSGLLYSQSGGDLFQISNLSKVFTFISPLQFSWISFIISVGYMFIFSLFLFFSVYLNVCLRKNNELSIRSENYRKELLENKRNLKRKIKKLKLLESKVGFFEEITHSLVDEYQKKEAELLKKINSLIEKDNKESGNLEIFMFPHYRFINGSRSLESVQDYPEFVRYKAILKLKLFFNIEPNTGNLKNPFTKIINKTKDEKCMKWLPPEVILDLDKFQSFLEILSKKYDESLDSYKDTHEEIERFSNETTELEKKVEKLEKEKNNMDTQLNDLENFNPFKKLNRIHHNFKNR